MNSSMEKRAQRVQEAARIGLQRRMYEREQSIIARLVTEYRSGTITSEKLYGGIAAISELRSIAVQSEHDLMQAEDDTLNLMNQGK